MLSTGKLFFHNTMSYILKSGFLFTAVATGVCLSLRHCAGALRCILLSDPGHQSISNMITCGHCISKNNGEKHAT